MTAITLDLNATVGVSEAARILGIRVESLRKLTNKGAIPCQREHNEKAGYDFRVLKLVDILRYRDARIARLRAELAELEGA